MAGWTHTVFPVDDASRIGEARRFVAALVDGLEGWSAVEAGRAALIVTELGTNLQRHAQKGRLLIAARPDAAEIEIIAMDEGPGIADIERCMADGYSSGSGSPGTGLGALRRLASDFELHSVVGEGTVCVARLRPAGRPRLAAAVQVGAVCVAVHGETACGDGWAAAMDGDQAALVLADGLGHGPEAAKASGAATAAFAAQPFSNMAGQMGDIHQALQTTRGAALCLLRLDADTGLLRCLGAGNIAIRVVSGTFDRSMATQHGTAGVQVRKPQEATLQVPPHALVIAHSDGIETRWNPQRLLPLLERDATLVAAVLLRDHSRQRDDATVVVLRRTA